MTSKCYRYLSLTIIAAVGAACAIAVTQSHYWLFAAAVLTGALLQLALHKRAPEIVVDERDSQIAGQAAQTAVRAFAWICLGAAIPLFFLREHNPQFAVIGATLTLVAIGQLLFFGLYSIYLNRRPFGKRPRLFAAFAALFIVVLTVFAIRVLSGEDDWICDNGRWVMHGHPDAGRPAGPCPSVR